MKRPIFLLLIFCILLLPACSEEVALEIPEHTEQFYVNDYADVLDFETESTIVKYGRQLEELTGAQLVVLTIKSLDGRPLEEYSLRVLRGWGIGQEEENNGVLILLAVDDRQSRIEVGYGLEGALPDGKTGRIQDEYMLPYFKEGDYSKGILEGYKALLVEIYKEYGIEPEEEITATPQPIQPQPIVRRDINPIRLLIAISILLLFDQIFLGGAILRTIFIILFSGRRGGPRGGPGGWGGGGYSGGGGGWRGGGGSGGGGGSSRSW